VQRHGDTVGGQAHVHLQRGDAEGERGLEARQRVLRRQAPGAAMPLQIEVD